MINKDAKIASLLDAGLSTDSIIAAIENEFPEIIPQDGRRLMIAKTIIPYNDNERKKILTIINKLKNSKQASNINDAEDEPLVKSADDIPLFNRQRLSWGNEALDYIYGSTAFIHTSDDIDGKWRIGDPMLLDRNYCTIAVRDSRGQLFHNIDYSKQLKQHGSPEAFTSIWAGTAGVGKSRLSIDVCKNFIKTNNAPILYFNGEAEERDFRIWLGADVDGELFKIMSPNSSLLKTDTICKAIRQVKPKLVIVDSLQMIYEIHQGRDGIENCMRKFKALKSEQDAGFPHIVFISHLTKDNKVYGSVHLSHMVDFVGMMTKIPDVNSQFMFECPQKNRGGITPRKAIFEHTNNGVKIIEICK
jgi:AAA domain